VHGPPRRAGRPFVPLAGRQGRRALGDYDPNYAVTASVGPYRWLGVDAQASAIYSHGPKAGLFRGFGAPKPVFAIECLLDELAQRLELDPLELRLRNALAEGEVTGLGFPAAETLGYREVLEATRPDYQAMLARVADFNAAERGGRRHRRALGRGRVALPRRQDLGVGSHA
jgi:CO/xanthine dehydrogenase Mo-binding subunit